MILADEDLRRLIVALDLLVVLGHQVQDVANDPNNMDKRQLRIRGVNVSATALNIKAVLSNNSS